MEKQADVSSELSALRDKLNRIEADLERNSRSSTSELERMRQQLKTDISIKVSETSTKLEDSLIYGFMYMTIVSLILAFLVIASVHRFTASSEEPGCCRNSQVSLIPEISEHSPAGSEVRD